MKLKQKLLSIIKNDNFIIDWFIFWILNFIYIYGIIYIFCIKFINKIDKSIENLVNNHSKITHNLFDNLNISYFLGPDL